jgi:pimeloyl-ACP methyl ester carboxylesterase
MRPSIPAAILACLALLLLAAPLSASAATTAPKLPSFPVDDRITGSPGITPPGANIWSCKPSAARPDPVVLVHGTFGDMSNWSWSLRRSSSTATASSRSTCRARDGAIANASAALGAFVDRVLAATGAAKVGHRRPLAGRDAPAALHQAARRPDKVDDLVAWPRRTTARSSPRSSTGSSCPLRGVLRAGYNSSFLKALNAAPEAPAPVDYTNVTTAWDSSSCPTRRATSTTRATSRT